MLYLRNVRLRWSAAAVEKQAQPLISHSIRFEQGFDFELFSSSRWRVRFLEVLQILILLQIRPLGFLGGEREGNCD